MVKSKHQKPSTTVLKNQNQVVYSAKRFSDLPKITTASAVDIEDQDTLEKYVKNVVLKSLLKLLEEREWVTLL